MAKPVVIRAQDKDGGQDLIVYVPVPNGETQTQEKFKLDESDLEFNSLVLFFRTAILSGQFTGPGARDKLLKLETDLNNPWLLEEAKTTLGAALHTENINRWRQSVVQETDNFRIMERILKQMTGDKSITPNQFKIHTNPKSLILDATEDSNNRALLQSNVKFHPETSDDLRAISRKTHQALRSVSQTLVKFLTGAQRVSNVQNLFYIKDLMATGPFGRYDIYFKFGDSEGEIVVLRIVKGSDFSQSELQNSLRLRDKTLKIAKREQPLE